MKAMTVILAITFLVSPSAFPDISPPDFNQLVQAIYFAEGGPRAKHPFGILSVSCKGYEGCRRVAFNTVRNNWQRFNDYGYKTHSDYLSFLASRYAPINSDTDNGTNQFWLKNVRYFLANPKEAR